MFGMGIGEVVVVLFIVLLVFGPGRLPEMIGSLGKRVQEFKEGTAGHGCRRGRNTHAGRQGDALRAPEAGGHHGEGRKDVSATGASEPRDTPARRPIRNGHTRGAQWTAPATCPRSVAPARPD